MSGFTYPPTLLEPIATDAGGDFLTNPMPEAPTGTNAASLQQGFPPITMENKLAGGKPPLGQDMNGFMFLITSHTAYVQAGQLYLFNADLATAMGGYAVGTILGMVDGVGLWLNIVDANTSNPDTGGAGWVPIAAYGNTTVPVTGGTTTLTAAQSRFEVIVLTGVLASNQVINLPPTLQEWLVVNRTSGAFTTTVKTAVGGSAGVTVPQGGFSSPIGVYSIGDGNIYPTVAPLSVPIDQNPTPLTIVERTNAGYVLATVFNTTIARDALAISSLFYETASDGFIRKISLTDAEAQMLLQGLGGQLVNGQVPFAVVAQWASALFTSPVFTGVPTAPTAGLGVSNTQVATTGFANPGASLAIPGWERRASGILEAFGEVHIGDVVAPSSGAVSFPVGFAAIYSLTVTPYDASGNLASWVAGANNLSLAGFTWAAREIASSTQDAYIMWRVIGR